MRFINGPLYTPDPQKITMAFKTVFKSNSNLGLPKETVSQLLVELSRTLKGQNGKEFDFQKI